MTSNRHWRRDVLLPLGVILLLVLHRRRRLVWGISTPPPSEPPDHYFEGPDLTAAQRDFVLDALRRYPSAGKARQELITAFETATRIDLPLVDGKLDWDWLEQEAKRRGCSWEDAWGDLIGKRWAPS